MTAFDGESIPDMNTVVSTIDQRTDEKLAKATAELEQRLAAQASVLAARQAIESMVDAELRSDPLLADDPKALREMRQKVLDRVREDPEARAVAADENKLRAKLQEAARTTIKEEEEKALKRAQLKAAERVNEHERSMAGGGEGGGSAGAARGRPRDTGGSVGGDLKFGPGTDWSESRGQVLADTGREAERFLRENKPAKV